MATVLESRQHGPQLCAVVAESMPPQCGGPDVAGWDWGAVNHQAANGTTWGSYLLTGRWDEAAKRFTLTEPALNGDQVPNSARPPVPAEHFASTCPTPAGGWRPVEPAKATESTMQQALTLAEADPQFAGAWLDQGYLPASFSESMANDPGRLVLNFRFTGDLARHEQQIRAVWGGALCLSPANRTLAELEHVLQEITADRQNLRGSVDEVTGVVQITVTVATSAAQAALDQRYGPGVVVLTGWLKPID
jgi:hypothetical protein